MDNYNNLSFDINEKNLFVAQKYEELLTKELNVSIIPDIIEMKSECKSLNNFHYFYLYDILLADTYINLGKLDDALALMLKDYDEINKERYSDIHINVLDRIIYVYITKQYYQSALMYSNEKKKYLIDPTNEVVNRWYLEMAYIHEALGEKNRSLMELNAILENKPDDNMRLVVLSNITKLYIDEGNINQALYNLGECFALCFKLDDKDSENYCKYLRAKIYRLQKSYKKALKFFEDLFKTIDNIEEDNFNYLNEYISLLLDIKDYNEAKKICEKNLPLIKNSKDLFNQKIFYVNYLRIRTNLAISNKNNIDYIFEEISRIEKKIADNKDLKNNEIQDIELDYEIKSKSKENFDRISEIINKFRAIKTENVREYLKEFSTILEKECGVNETAYFILSRDNKSIVPEKEDLLNIEAFNYKVNRFYERKISYKDLEDTAVETIMSGYDNVAIDFTDTPTRLLDPITHSSYVNHLVKYLSAFAIKTNDELYGCIIYISKSTDITSGVGALILEIATSILEKQLLKVFSDININEQKDLIETALSGIDVNIIYHNKQSRKIYLPEKIKEMLGVYTTEISFDEYEKLIDSSDIYKYRDKMVAIENNKEYKVSYHLNINNNILSILEQAKPYNETYYYGTISNVDVTKSVTETIDTDKIYGIDDLLIEINNLKTYDIDKNIHFDVSAFKVVFNEILTVNEKSQIIDEIYNSIKKFYNTKVYLLDDIFVVISSDKSLFKHFRDTKKGIVRSYNVSSFMSKIIKPEFKCFTVSYPKQFANISDLVEIIKFSAEKIDSESFDKNCYAQFIAYRTINDCAYNALQFEKLDFIFTKIYKGKEEVGLFVIPNIKGLNTPEALINLTTNIKIKLDEKLFKNILDLRIDNVYLTISMQAAKNLIINLDENELRKVKLNLILDEFTYDYEKVIIELNRLGHSVIISGKDVSKLTVELLANNYIAGIYNIESEDIDNIKYLNEDIYLLTSSLKNENSLENNIFKNIITISKDILN